MRNEMLSAKNDKLIKKNYAEMFIEEMNTLMRENINVDKKKINMEIDDKQAELNIIMNDINNLELNLKKKETIFSKDLCLIFFR